MMFTYFHVASGCPLLRKNTPHQVAKDGFDQDTTVKVIMATTRDRSEESLGPVVGWISPDNEMSYEVSWKKYIYVHSLPWGPIYKAHQVPYYCKFLSMDWFKFGGFPVNFPLHQSIESNHQVVIWCQYFHIIFHN